MKSLETVVMMRLMKGMGDSFSLALTVLLSLLLSPLEL
jgi:hypothetical protein